MSPTLAVALFDLWVGALLGLPPFGHHPGRLGGQVVTLDQVEAEVAIARDPQAAATALLLDLGRLRVGP